MLEIFEVFLEGDRSSVRGYVLKLLLGNSRVDLSLYSLPTRNLTSEGMLNWVVYNPQISLNSQAVFNSTPGIFPVSSHSSNALGMELGARHLWTF